jgi:demethylmenaquinone methyltransferase/2-methoxy-6-polyprenyl-1,4-benzoquinol methylase
VGSVNLKFRVLAAFYDLFDLVFTFDRKSNPRFALAKEIQNEHFHILDVCVGTANGSLVVARANHRNDIIGIDLSPDMLAVARKKTMTQGTKNLVLFQMDAMKMAFRDRSFHIAMISFGLHELPFHLMIKILHEMFRVLKDEGKLYIVDYRQENGFIKKMIFKIYLRIFEPNHMEEFLEYDWEGILGEIGFRMAGTKKCLFSQVITASKEAKGFAGRLYAIPGSA